MQVANSPSLAARLKNVPQCVDIAYAIREIMEIEAGDDLN